MGEAGPAPQRRFWEQKPQVSQLRGNTWPAFIPLPRLEKNFPGKGRAPLAPTKWDGSRLRSHESQHSPRCHFPPAGRADKVKQTCLSPGLRTLRTPGPYTLSGNSQPAWQSLGPRLENDRLVTKHLTSLGLIKKFAGFSDLIPY